MKTYLDLENYEYSDAEFTYQSELTGILDSSSEQPFTQELLNEIVLWKINRFVKADDKLLALFNTIDLSNKELNSDLTQEILHELLKTKGIGLAMASTILRFRNPTLYQIIDQRAYRFVYGKELILSDYYSEKNIQNQVSLYINYLIKLREISKETGWRFSDLDRILYLKDKQLNTDKTIKYS
jgi:thermostable 8-oxoguanine DNA glycosylase